MRGPVLDRNPALLNVAVDFLRAWKEERARSDARTYLLPEWTKTSSDGVCCADASSRVGAKVPLSMQSASSPPGPQRAT